MKSIKDQPFLRLVGVLPVLTLVLSGFLPWDMRGAFAQDTPMPTFNVRPELDWVDGWNWLPGSVVTLEIDDPSNGVGVDYSDTQTTETGDLRFEFGAVFDVQPGHLVTLRDGEITKDHTVTNLAVTSVDPVADTVAGTADPYGEINVYFHELFCGLVVIADGSGYWMADFSGYCDIIPGTSGAATESDEDDDATFIDWSVPLSTFAVRPELDWVDGWNWLPGSVVTLEIDDPSNGVGVDYSDTQTTETGDLRFEFGAVFDVQPGHLVTLRDGEITKDHTVTNLAVTSVDPVADTVAGTADPYGEINVYFHELFCGLVVIADGSGYWMADFSGYCDIIPGTSGAATESDEDDDATFIDWSVPHFLASSVDIKPDTLNLKSKGKWVTAYIELPDSYDVADIDVSTVMLEGTIPAEDHPTEIGDYDNDGITDLMVKFDRQALIEYLDGTTGEVTLTVSGELNDGTPFEGSDTITVINPGKKK